MPRPSAPRPPRRGSTGRKEPSRRQKAADERAQTGEARTQKWGGLARRAAARSSDSSASSAWRAASDAARRDREGEDAAPPLRDGDLWIDEGAVREEAAGAVGRGRGRGRPGTGARRRGADTDDRPGSRGGSGASARGRSGSRPAGRRGAGADGGPGPQADDVEREEARRPRQRRDDEVGSELGKAVGAKKGAQAAKRLKDASQAFRRGRYDEARRLLRPLAEAAPQVATVRELYGLTLYRLGRWKDAARELEAFRTLTDTVDQHPVLADSYRALRRYDEVDELWSELRSASPSAPLVAEGRIVAAGALADQGRIEDAIRTLEPAVKSTKKAKTHHLRMAYALADLYERAGDVPRARELFERVASADPDFVDVQSRLNSID